MENGGIALIEKIDYKNKPEYIYETQNIVEEYDRLFEDRHKISIVKNKRPINFNHNGSLPIHRWTPYVQGFSAIFVNDYINKVRKNIKINRILDPFAGSGTVNVYAKMRGIDSIAVELNPLLHFITLVKTTWDVNVNKVNEFLKNLDWNIEPTEEPPKFLRETKNHFKPEILEDLLILKSQINSVSDEKVRNLLLLGFASILTDVSNLKRSPCLGYDKNKNVPNNAVRTKFKQKISEFIWDLLFVQEKNNNAKVECYKEDSRLHKYPSDTVELSITSPPYASGMDYVMNYKIELAWLNFISNYDEAKNLKNRLIVCDNVSRNLTKEFLRKKNIYSEEWLDDIIEKIKKNVETRGKYRRHDIHLIVQKYFDDLYPVLENVYEGLVDGGKFILVIGDSLMVDVYLPTDLIVANMASEIGFKVESVEIARDRYSGQRREFRLRETITTLEK